MPITRKMRSRFFQITGCIEIAWSRKIDIDNFLDRRGTRTHDRHPVGELDRFFDVVRDKKNCFLFALPDPHEIGAHFLVRKRLKEIAFFTISRNDTLTV
jgi:hypothetical protein